MTSCKPFRCIEGHCCKLKGLNNIAYFGTAIVDGIKESSFTIPPFK
jgi:hypothetical protein